MERIIVMVLKNLFLVPIWMLKIWWYGKRDNISELDKFNLLKYITTRVNKSGNVIIAADGFENIPKESGFILFPNHQGLFDVLAFLESCPTPFSVVIKKEAANIILVKQIRVLLKGLSIDREDIRQSMNVIMQMTKEVKEGRNYIIFAEGTRSKKQNQVQDFKGGSFKSAINAKCPIVPVAILDAFKAFDTKSIKPVTVQVHYLKPLYYEEYKDLKSMDIAKIVKERIENCISQHEQNNITG